MVHISIDPQTRTRVTALEGVVGDRELLAACDEVLGDPAYDRTLDDLVDLHAVRRLEVSAAGVRRLAERFAAIDPRGTRNRLAVVATESYMYGLARMYQLLRGDAAQVEVFRDRAEAERWLAAGRARAGEQGRAAPPPVA